MDWKFVGTGSIDVMMKEKMCPGMVDTGAKMNIINVETVVKLGLEVDENDCGFLNGASGKTGYNGVASNVVIEIGRVKRGGSAGPSGPTLRKGGQMRDQKVSRNLEELPIYRAGDSLRVFLRDLEEYAFRKEWGDREKLANVTGAGMYKKRIEGVVAGCTRWRICKMRLWKEMGVFPMDYVEDDLRFDETNVEDFIDSLQLAARRDQTRKERLQERELWIGRKMDESQRKEAEDEKEDDVPLKRLKNKARVAPKSSDKGSDQAKRDEHEEMKETERRKRIMGASAAPRERRIGEKIPAEIGRKEVQEKGSEKAGGSKETGEVSIGDKEGKEGEKGEKEGKLRRAKEVEAEVGKRRAEGGESSQLRKEVEEGQYDDLPVNSTWDVRFEGMLLSELVVSSKHSENLQKMMEVHEMLDEKCTKLFEDYAEIVGKMGRMEKEDEVKEVGENLDTVGKGLQADLKGNTELFTQGFLDYIPGLLKEMSRLRKKEEERDTQVAKLVGDMEGMRKEVEELKKGKEELQKQVRQLRAALTMKGRELEDEAAARGRVEKMVEDLCFEVSAQGVDMDTEISERKKLRQEWEKIWGEILKGMGGLKLSHQGKEKETTEMVERNEGEGKWVQTEERREESPGPEREVSESVAMPLPTQGKKQREFELGSPEGTEDQAETSGQTDMKKIKPNMVGKTCFFCT
ncbi:hypothetical protein CBR_g40528 [Chara braunii]|uniref:Peptidase A2 domain-containing protein n=1 Tax=Chara braunii TaxID=69332 RepID=A0A388K1Z9_CHABU|nr:hypothetical protein CBR_g40528 [Chara braunii]|eukprot:GBG64080.1 hypothetical protein CBR_g40528 [Chara braunii]